MSAEDRVLAVCCSDIHLSRKRPKARKETDWPATMAKVLLQVKELAAEHGAVVLCAGDVFDRWNAPAELISFAIQNLPYMFSIPGNHDLPMHSNRLIGLSAYWTLYSAEAIMHLISGIPWTVNGMNLYGFGLGEKPKICRGSSGKLNVALVHEYLWVQGKSYTGARDEDRLSKRAEHYRDFDVVVVGDNHKGFIQKLKCGTHVINCGSLMRRKSDEIDYQPQVGLIHESGKVTSHKLDISEDKIEKTENDDKTEEWERENTQVTAFIEALIKAHKGNLDFKETMKQALRSATPQVKEIILEAMDSEE